MIIKPIDLTDIMIYRIFPARFTPFNRRTTVFFLYLLNIISHPMALLNVYTQILTTFTLSEGEKERRDGMRRSHLLREDGSALFRDETRLIF